MLKFKELSALLLLALLGVCLFSACGDDTPSAPPPPPPSPAEVVLSENQVWWQWTYILGYFYASGIATNTGDETAYDIQVRMNLYNAANVRISQSTWSTVLNQLAGGASKGYDTRWQYTDRSLESAASYALEVLWQESANGTGIERTFSTARTPLK